MTEEDDFFEDTEMTTLSVPKKFREELVEEHTGSNDMARLFNWAEQYSHEKSYEAVQDFMQTADFEEWVTEIIRNKLEVYNSDLRDSFENAIEETVRDMRRG